MDKFNYDMLQVLMPSNLRPMRVIGCNNYNSFSGLRMFFLKHTNEKIADQMIRYLEAYRTATIAPNRSGIF